VYQFHPPASRRSSSEIYLVAKGFKGAESEAEEQGAQRSAEVGTPPKSEAGGLAATGIGKGTATSEGGSPRRAVPKKKGSGGRGIL
jgi:hypothetical protein